MFAGSDDFDVWALDQINMLSGVLKALFLD
jgi:hypothetical protein